MENVAHLRGGVSVAGFSSTPRSAAQGEMERNVLSFFAVSDQAAH